MLRELKLEAKIVAGGNQSAGRLSPTIDLWCLLNSGWELSGKEHLSPLSFQNTSSAWSDQVPDFQGAGHTAFNLPRSVDGGKHTVLTTSHL